MFKKKKSTVKPDLPKEYVWTLIIEEEEHEYKCLVTETQVITYEDGVEHKHLKITDPTCMEGVLQIDTQTKIFGDMVDFQLERFIPYIRLEGRWVMSHTTEKDRMNEQIAIYKKQSMQETITGIGSLLIVLAKQLITGDIGDWWMLTVFGIFFISSAAYRMVRLRNEINALKEIEEEAAAEKAAEKSALPEGIDALKSGEE
ncbi:MAG: hypothetical protein IJD98_03390 [Oscillospiraceae bacterium]|nr:hypothetical protein [Oscillospiraceae bacterium]